MPDIDLHVAFMRDNDNGTGRTEVQRAPGRIMYGLGPRRWPDEWRLHPRAIVDSAIGWYDCFILSGSYASVTFLACAVTLTLRRKRWAAWLERPRVGEYQSRLAWHRLGQRLKRFVLRRVLQSAERVIAIGTAAAATYRQMGVPEDKLRVLPYCCDTRKFEHVPDNQIELLRHAYQINGQKVLLFSGQLILRKGVDTLIEIFTRLSRTHEDLALLVLGDGPQRSQLQEQVPQRLRGRVHFLGHRPQNELPAFFALADVFVFPSRHDGWGVVINEACAAGLPVVASRQTGAAIDLVREGQNGYLLDCDDVDGFVARVDEILSSPELARRLGGESRNIATSYSIQTAARRFVQILDDGFAQSVDPSTSLRTPR